MPFMDEYSKITDELRAAMDEVNKQMMKLEDLFHEHFNLTRKAKPMPPSVLTNLEKDLIK